MFNSKQNRSRHRISGKPALYDPADTEWGIPRPLGRWSKRRPTRRGIAIFVCLVIMCTYVLRSWRGPVKVEVQEAKPPSLEPEGWENKPKPPLFGQYHQAELAFPQHHVGDPFAGGKKYLWVENHVHGLGWGNHMQDLLFNAQLALSAGRAFVFDNYTWNRDGSVYSDYNGKLIPSQIPFSALINGPIVGSPFPENDATLRAIHRQYWHQICPEPMTIWTQDVKKIINDDNASALTILKTWIDHLSKIDEPCLQIDGGVERIFDMYLYGQKDRVLDIWPVLSESPLIHYMGYSPLIHAAFDINKELFTSLPISEPYYACSALPSAHTTTAGTSRPPQRCSDPYTPIPGLLALHLRRGDFEGHCAHLAKWGAAWAGFNSFPMFPDQWVTPEGSGWGETTEEGLALYLKRCYPDVSQIVAKIKEIRKTPAARGIKDIYIMTNGKSEWLAELKTSIKAMGGWNKIASSRDLVITKEQKEVAQAIDMMIGERAQVIIGNGWSSMTSNIVMMRMARGLQPESNRFW